MVGFHNPYWGELQRLIDDRSIRYHEGTDSVEPYQRFRPAMKLLERKYSPTISDPKLVEYVAKVCGTGVVEVDSGSGYWSMLLTQLGKVASAYDLSPRFITWQKVHRMGRSRLDLVIHRDDTLICMSNAYPYKSFTLALARYPGSRFLLSAERDPYEAKDLAELLKQYGWFQYSCERGRRAAARPYTVYEFRRPQWNQPTQRMPEVAVRDVA